MMGRLMMAVRDLEGEFRAAVAEFQAAKAEVDRLNAELGFADCELVRARNIHAAARDRYLDAEFYKTGQRSDAVMYDDANRMAAVERGIGKPKGPLCGAQGQYGARGIVFECRLEQGHSGKHRS
jgi:hypothetical protein